MRFYVAADHAGFEMKEMIKFWLMSDGHEVIDCGANELIDGDDYPIYMHVAGQKLEHEPEARSVVFGGSGTGEMIVMNRHAHVRCSLYYGGNIEIVRLARAHNDANALSISSRMTTLDEAKQAITVFIESEFDGGRHERRVAEIDE